jgi:hypothetical protein
MRAAALTGFLLLTASAAQANPLAERLALPSQDALTARYAFLARADPALLGDAHIHYTPSARGFSIGPFHADGAETVGLGRRGGLKPHYRLEGVSIMGGSVGGTVDGRGAMLSLHWSDNN